MTPKGRSLAETLLGRHKLLDRNLEKTFGVRERRRLEKLLDAFCRLDSDPDIDGHGS